MSKTNIEYHNLILKNLSEGYIRWFELEKKELQKNILKKKSVLDVGCGEGRLFELIKNKHCELFGVDIDQKAIESTRKNFPSSNLFLSDAVYLPFKDNFFDYVTCIGTFGNFDKNKIKILKEMKRVVNKNGQIIISVFNEDAFEERMNLYKKLNIPLKKIKKTKVIFDTSVGANISEQFSLEELNNIFDKTGLKVIEIKKEGIGYFCRSKK